MKRKIKLTIDIIFTAHTLLIILAVVIPQIIPITYELPATSNSNAKLAFTNAATYLAKCDAVSGTSLTDGVYCGTLYYDDNSAKPSPLYNGTYEDFDTAMKMLMGGSFTNAGNYVVIITDGMVVHSYWSRSDELTKYAGALGSSVYIGKPCSRNTTFDSYGVYLGGYPTECSPIGEKLDKKLSSPFTVFEVKTPLSFTDKLKRLGQKIIIFIIENYIILYLYPVSLAVYIAYSIKSRKKNTA